MLPGPHQWWAGWLYPDRMHLPDYVWASTLPGLNPTPTWYGTGLETAVGIPLIAILLALRLARARRPRRGFFSAWPSRCCAWARALRIDGVVTPVRLPFVVAKRVPGLNVMRTPGRYMLLGAVGLALGAGAGCRR